MRGPAARVLECAAGGRRYSACEPSFAEAGIGEADGAAVAAVPLTQANRGTHFGGPVTSRAVSA